MIVTGIDPGGTTGVTMLSTDDWKPVYLSLKPDEFMDRVTEIVELSTYVGCERYVITTRTASLSRQLDALYNIGMIQLECRRLKTPLELQTPADAKKSFSDAFLRTHDLWHSSDHVRDATRHALLRARRIGYEVHRAV